MKELTEMAKAAAERRAMIEVKELALSIEKKGLIEMEGRILSAMETLELQNFKLMGIGIFFIQHRLFAKMTNKIACFEHVRKLGAGDMIQETIHPSTLRSFAGELFKEGKPPLEGVETTYLSQIGFRKEK
jgi:hypothetical protein